MVWGKRYIGVPLFRQIGSTDKSTATGRCCGPVSQRREMGFRCVAMVSVLFVCLGNICRSPTAEGVFRQLCENQGVISGLRIDSAGTAGWHDGKPPDGRAVAAARQHGIDLTSLRARQVSPSDFYSFDYILAMDGDNLSELQQCRPPDSTADIRLFLSYAIQCEQTDVPDPYYGGDEGFEQVLELTRNASAGFLMHLIARGQVAAVEP